MTKSKLLRCSTLWAATSAAVFSLNAAEPDTSKLPPAASQTGVTFAKDVQPIFKASCFKCHGEMKQKAGLRLDSLAAVLKGGENAPNIVKGDSKKSTLIHAVARLDADSAMPPDGKGDPLTPQQIGILRAWIDQGAK